MLILKVKSQTCIHEHLRNFKKFNFCKVLYFKLNLQLLTFSFFFRFMYFLHISLEFIKSYLFYNIIMISWFNHNEPQITLGLSTEPKSSIVWWLWVSCLALRIYLNPSLTVLSLNVVCCDGDIYWLCICFSFALVSFFFVLMLEYVPDSLQCMWPSCKEGRMESLSIWFPRQRQGNCTGAQNVRASLGWLAVASFLTAGAFAVEKMT